MALRPAGLEVPRQASLRQCYARLYRKQTAQLTGEPAVFYRLAAIICCIVSALSSASSLDAW